MKDRSSVRRKIAVVATVPIMVRFFLVNHIHHFSKEYDVTVISNMDGQREILDILPDDVKKIDLPILRPISLLADLKALFLLARCFHRENFSIVYSISPKGTLLSMVSAWFTGVPDRIANFHGQIWVNRKGTIRFLLKLMDYIVSTLATVVIVDSPSQRDFLIKNHVVKEGQAVVLGDGSICGVDIERFSPKQDVRKLVREKMGATDSIVFLFVGRLKRDKGVIELVEAFCSICGAMDHVALWLVGPDEDGLQNQLESMGSNHVDSIHFVSYTTAPEDYMVSADIFCLPSYREGFGSSIIEAAACGIPAIGSRIYGISDAIVDGKTGLLVEKGDATALASAMLNLANHLPLRKKMGDSARQRVLEKFQQQSITDELMMLIKNL